MGKILKIAAIAVGAALIFVPGAQGVAAGILSGVGIGGGVTAFGLAAAGALTSVIGAIGVSAAFEFGSKALGLGPKSPKVSRATIDRLYASIDPDTARKMVFGRTALATDVRYQGYTGTGQEYYHQIIAVASHKIAAAEELWLEDKLAWNGTVQGDYVGYLTVDVVLEGSSSNMIDIDSKWGSSTNRRLTGCAYIHLRYKLTGNTKKAESPFASSVPSRMTIIGKGIAVYDPRRDSTARGSGSMRANDQSTWAYSVSGTDIGRNPALSMLTYLLGWRINGKLAVGRGVPPARIDMASFITAANLCDETVTLAVGGTEPRYRFDGIASEEDDGGSVLDGFKVSMNALLRDAGGRLALNVLHNDLSAPVVHFTEADVLGPFQWDQTGPLTEDRNIVRGRYTSAATNALYQLVDYPQVSITSPDGIDRVHSLDLPCVQSVSQAQRLAKQMLQRLQYQGTFSAPVNAKGWGVQVGDVVTWSFYPLGFTDRLFRVVERTVQFDGVCDMVFQEEHVSIYAWDAEEAAAVTLAAPTVYDYRNSPLLQGLDEIELTPGPPGDPGPQGDPGDDGDPGDPGIDALTASSSPPLILVPTSPTGTPLATIPGFAITVYKGSTDVTNTSSGTSYSITDTSNVSGVSHTGNGVFGGTITLSADSGYIEVTVTNGASFVVRVAYVKVKAGSPANAAVPTHISTMNDTSTYAVIATLVDIAIANGQTLYGDAGVIFSVSGAYTHQCKLTYQNITDSGSETDFTGSENSDAHFAADNPQSISSNGSWTNSTGHTCLMRVRFYQRRSAGGGASSGIDGTLGGHT